jgi:hypothetical protein
MNIFLIFLVNLKLKKKIHNKNEKKFFLSNFFPIIVFNKFF